MIVLLLLRLSFNLKFASVFTSDIDHSVNFNAGHVSPILRSRFIGRLFADVAAVWPAPTPPLVPISLCSSPER